MAHGLNLRKVNGRWRICTGPSTAGAALSIVLSLLPRNSKAAYRFLGKILNNVRSGRSRSINTDKAPAYGRALALLQTRRPVRLDVNTDRLSTGTT
nr:Mobile element protein [Escherichia coli]